MKKRLVSLLLCVGMAFSLCACGGGNMGGAQEGEDSGGSSGSSGNTVSLLSWYTEEQMAPVKEGFELANPDCAPRRRADSLTGAKPVWKGLTNHQ